jgi:hypothetical protein
MLVINGFAGVVVAAAGEAPFAFADHGMGAEGYDRSIASVSAQGTNGRVTIEGGHLKIHEDRVEGEAELLGFNDALDGRPPIVDDLDIGPFVAKHESEETLVIGMVLGQKHLSAGQSPGEHGRGKSGGTTRGRGNGDHGWNRSVEFRPHDAASCGAGSRICPDNSIVDYGRRFKQEIPR